jgi:DNA-directed RNA polymerase specialized sigma54-like protein
MVMFVMQYEPIDLDGGGAAQLLTPRMIQSMEILQLAPLGLEERIEQELQNNPVLATPRGPMPTAPTRHPTASTGSPLGREQHAVARHARADAPWSSTKNNGRPTTSTGSGPH